MLQLFKARKPYDCIHFRSRGLNPVSHCRALGLDSVRSAVSHARGVLRVLAMCQQSNGLNGRNTRATRAQQAGTHPRSPQCAAATSRTVLHTVQYTIPMGRVLVKPVRASPPFSIPSNTLVEAVRNNLHTVFLFYARDVVARCISRG